MAGEERIKPVHSLSCLLFNAGYISSLPACARPHLELQLDYGHEGVNKDLSEIAYHMLGWDNKLSAYLGLTDIDIHDISRDFQGQINQR